MRRVLDKFFNPKSIAVVGASNRKDRVGYQLFQNLVQGGYKGKLYPLNLKYATIQGVRNLRRLNKVLPPLDLVIIVTPTHTLLDIIDQCGQKHVPAILIITAGLYESSEEEADIKQGIHDRAEKFGIRILGPDSLGLLNMNQSLNASIADRMALRGSVAFISQSGALCSSILDWSRSQKVGFSHVVSIGSTFDVDFHDVINYFGTDAHTACIIIYMESLRDARAFLSAARAFARSKPIIVLKAGKSIEDEEVAGSRSIWRASQDNVFDSAFKRAGVIRVDTIAELFHCAQALSMQAHPKGHRLAIITNANAPGILATDYLVANGGRLARLSEKMLANLQKILPNNWHYKDAIDITRKDVPQQYKEAVETCLAESEVDAVLVILTPQSEAHAIAVAQEIASVSRNNPKPVFASWMGEKMATPGRAILEENRIPNYRFPERAVDTFLKIHSYFKNLALLYEFTPTVPDRFVPQRKSVQKLLEQVHKTGEVQLTKDQSKRLLSFYEIPVIPGTVVQSKSQAIIEANALGYPVVLKANGYSLPEPGALGTVHLGLRNQDDVEKAYDQIQSFSVPHKGVLIERMIYKENKMIVGSSRDRLFGHFILFGSGGNLAAYANDYDIALLPLNMNLAKRLIEGTRLGKVLMHSDSGLGIDLEELQFLLYKIAYLVLDFPEIKSIRINPLAADGLGCLALDTSVTLDTETIPQNFHDHLAILPYPSHYEKEVIIKDGKVIKLRPIRPEDEPLEAELFERLSKETIYFRFFGYAPNVDHTVLSRFTHIDYDREMAIVAEIEEAGDPKLIGVVRMIADAWNERAEYAIVIADQWQGKGLGTLLTDFIIDIAREKSITMLEADVLAGNQAMVRLFRRRNFKFIRTDATEWHVQLEL